MGASEWTCALRLSEAREVVDGDRAALAAAIGRGADLRSYATFDYGEHMSAPESDVGLVQEMMNFGVVYLLGGERVAGIQTTRYPANCSLGFGDWPSLSFFLVNDNAQSGIARPFLDERQTAGALDVPPPPKYHALDRHDQDTRAPSENYHYEFGEYAFWVNERWDEVLAHDADGQVTSGSLVALQEAFRAGCALKVAVADLCADLTPEGADALAHEVFVEMGPIYNHEDQGFLGGESQPLVRVAASVPLAYGSGNWDFGWLIPRTDGLVHHLTVDPYGRQFLRHESHAAMRWFVG